MELSSPTYVVLFRGDHEGEVMCVDPAFTGDSVWGEGEEGDEKEKNK